MRIHELAAELGLSTKELTEKCRGLGITIPDSGLSSLTDDQTAAIRATLREPGDGQSQPHSPDTVLAPSSQVTDSPVETTEPPRKKGFISCPRCGAKLGKEGQCPRCNYRDVSDAEPSDSHIGLYGISQSGKTVFLASLTQRVLTIGRHERAVELDGWRPDVPTDRVRTTTAKICQKLVQSEPIDPTDKTVYDRFKFGFKRRMGFWGRESYVFQSHDVSGELLRTWVEGGVITPDQLATFSVDAARSIGLLILIDPKPELDSSNPSKGLQDALWRCLLDRLLAEQGGESLRKPVMFAISKCDDPAVAGVLEMPSAEEREEAERDPDNKLTAVIDKQNAAARRFLHTYMPQIWTAIDPDDADARVPKAHVIAMSSTGLNGDALRVAGKLRPWRIAEPVVWVLNQVRPWAYKHWRARLAIKSFIILCVLCWGALEWTTMLHLDSVENDARGRVSSGRLEDLKDAVQLCDEAASPYSLAYWLRGKPRLDNVKATALTQLKKLRVKTLLAVCSDKVSRLKDALAQNDVATARQLTSDVVTSLQAESPECRKLATDAETLFREQRDTTIADSAKEVAAVLNLVNEGKAEEAMGSLKLLLKKLIPWADEPAAANLLKKLKKDGDIRVLVNQALMKSYQERFQKAQEMMLRGPQDLGKKAADNVIADLKEQDFAEAASLAVQVKSWLEQFARDREAFTRITENLKQVEDRLKSAELDCDAAAANSLLEKVAAFETDVTKFPPSEPKRTLLELLVKAKSRASVVVKRRQGFDRFCLQARDAMARGDLRSAREPYKNAIELYPEKAVVDEADVVNVKLSEYDKLMQVADAAAKDLAAPSTACARFEDAMKVWPQGPEAPQGMKELRKAAKAKMSVLVADADRLVAAGTFSPCYPRLAAAIELASQVKLPDDVQQLVTKRGNILREQIRRSMDLSRNDDLKGAFVLATEARECATALGNKELELLAYQTLDKLAPGGVLWKNIVTENVRTLSAEGKSSEVKVTYFCNSLDMKFVLVKPRSGAEQDQSKAAPMPADAISRAFYISATEVTQSQYAAAIGETAPPSSSASLPVGTVSWTEAKVFCAAVAQKDKVVCDLPSESQWEFACRAGSTAAYSWGALAKPEFANYSASRIRDKVEVGRYPANGLGLFDMHGNVWEWCRDTYTDPQWPAGIVRRVRRGGSYLSNEALMKSGFRERMGKDERRPDVGFRVVIECVDKEQQ